MMPPETTIGRSVRILNGVPVSTYRVSNQPQNINHNATMQKSLKITVFFILISVFRLIMKYKNTSFAPIMQQKSGESQPRERGDEGEKGV